MEDGKIPADIEDIADVALIMETRAVARRQEVAGPSGMAPRAECAPDHARVLAAYENLELR